MNDAALMVLYIIIFKKIIDGPDTFSKNGKIFGEFANKITELV